MSSSRILIATLLAASFLPGIVQAQDARKEGGITRERVMQRANAQFERLDRNKDGFIDRAELQQSIEEAVAKLRARMTQRFEEADTNKDGRVSREEFLAARAAWFATVDTDGDGVIDNREMRTYLRARARNSEAAN